MATNVQKTPVARTLEQFAARKIVGIISLLGKALPASVVAVPSSGIVTVKFELTNIPYTIPNVTCPLFGPEWVRYPIQAGTLGVVFPADAYLGGVSGLGGGIADLTQRANLTSLVFFPIGNKNWTPAEDSNRLELYGPDGVLLKDTSGNTKMTVSPTSGVTVQASGGAVLNANLVEAANDSDAASKGVPINGFYHHSNGVLIRLT